MEYPSAPSGIRNNSNQYPRQSRLSFESEFEIDRQLASAHGSRESSCVPWNDWEDGTQDSDDDFTLKSRRSWMCFNGRPSFPPVAPDGSSFPPPTDLWYTEDSSIQQSGKSMPSFHMNRLSTCGHRSANNANVHNPGVIGQPVRPVQPLAEFNWSPYPTWVPPELSRFQAPVPRGSRPLDEPDFVPDTAYLLDAAAIKASAADTAGPIRNTPVNTALAQWYTEQVVAILVQPGHFREAVGGASDELWGPASIVKDAWRRIGRPPPRFVNPWGRMGMKPMPVMPIPVLKLPRNPATEPYDPYNAQWNQQSIVSPALVAFMEEVLSRMTIPNVNVIAAVWFLKGLGFHEGDGRNGTKLRQYLREVWGTSPFAVEKRVAVLGLILAGKYLDDHSYLVHSWTDTTEIPSHHLVRLERLALADLYFSLSIPASAWTNHVSQLFAQLASRNCAEDFTGSLLIPFFDEMVHEARAAEFGLHITFYVPQDVSRRLPGQGAPAAADQAITRAWGSFARSYQVDRETYQHSDRMVESQLQLLVEDQGWDDEMDIDSSVERAVSEIIDDFDDDDEEFLEYDGAKRWIMPEVNLYRSLSNWNSMSIECTRAINEWRLKSNMDQQLPDSIPSRPQTPSEDDYMTDSSSLFREIWKPRPQLSCCHHDCTSEERCDIPPVGAIGQFEPAYQRDRPLRIDEPAYNPGHSGYFDDEPIYLEPGITIERRFQQPPQASAPLPASGITATKPVFQPQMTSGTDRWGSALWLN